MKYKKYWSIADLGTYSIKSDELFLYIAICFIIAFILAKKFIKSNRDYEKSLILWLTGTIGIAAFICFVYLKFYTIDPTEQRIFKRFNSVSVATVEGIISEFESTRPASKRGIVIMESFVVDSVEFSYSDELLGRFNQFSNTNNGVFRNGLPIRITYNKADNEILLVEIGKE